MMKDEVLYGMLDEIRETIEANTEPDGNVRFDGLRIQVALDFVRTELFKSVMAEHSHGTRPGEDG